MFSEKQFGIEMVILLFIVQGSMCLRRWPRLGLRTTLELHTSWPSERSPVAMLFSSSGARSLVQVCAIYLARFPKEMSSQILQLIPVKFAKLAPSIVNNALVLVTPQEGGHPMLG
jgi:hypothetical protein